MLRGSGAGTHYAAASGVAGVITRRGGREVVAHIAVAITAGCDRLVGERGPGG